MSASLRRGLAAGGAFASNTSALFGVEDTAWGIHAHPQLLVPQNGYNDRTSPTDRDCLQRAGRGICRQDRFVHRAPRSLTRRFP